MTEQLYYNYKVVSEDNGYPKKGGVAALVGIYPTEEGAEFIKSVVRKRYPESNIVVLKTHYDLTVRYPENFNAVNFK